MLLQVDAHDLLHDVAEVGSDELPHVLHLDHGQNLLNLDHQGNLEVFPGEAESGKPVGLDAQQYFAKAFLMFQCVFVVGHDIQHCHDLLRQPIHDAFELLCEVSHLGCAVPTSMLQITVILEFEEGLGYLVVVETLVADFDVVVECDDWFEEGQE